MNSAPLCKTTSFVVLFFSPDIISALKSRQIRLAWRVERNGEDSACRVLVGHENAWTGFMELRIGTGLL
jgi:hypothetical protein